MNTKCFAESWRAHWHRNAHRRFPRARPKVWACAIVRVIGWVNFLDDSSQKPHMKLTAIDKAFGVGESTGQGKAMLIRTMFKIRPMDPAWSLRSRMDQNTLA